MVSLLIKNTFIKIKKSLGRFISILFIVALGVGLFSGLRQSTTDMLITADKYYDEYNLMDFKIVSTLGLTDKDVHELSKIKKVNKVIPSYSKEVIANDIVLKIYALEEVVNQVKLLSGRMPETNNECLAESSYKIGDIINIKKDNNLKEDEYKVVGIIQSPLYVGQNRGITNLGNGEINSYLYVLKDNFQFDYYTEIYLLMNKKLVSYSDEYDKQLTLINNELEQIKPLMETRRYEEIYQAAMIKINDAKDELSKFQKSTEKKLNNAKNTLDNKNNLVSHNLQTIDKSFEELQNKKEIFNLEMIEQKQKISLAKDNYQKEIITYENNKLFINNKIKELQEQLIIATEEQKILLNEEINILNNELLTAEKTIIETETIITKGEEELLLKEEKYLLELDKIEKELNANKEQLLEARNEIKKGYHQYYTNLNTYNKEVKKAQEEINIALKKAKAIEKPTWYLFDRNDNSNYNDFKEDALKVDAIAKVFPIFFIVVAALICLNSMTRMIEEERGELGILRAIGFSKCQIIGNYVGYAALASIVGIILGLIAGFIVIPLVIYSVYDFNYHLSELSLIINYSMIIIISIFVLILISIVTIYSCNKELQNNPSVLLRPKAPLKGKKIFLERISIIWEKLSFTWKVTIRNLFRYKKRIIMTILGVAGCTALLLTGFGLKDGIGVIGELQYEKIIKYDALISLKKEPDKDIIKILDKNNITNYLFIHQETVTFTSKEKKNEAYLIVNNGNNLLEFINLIDYQTGESLELKGAIITTKIAKLLNLKVGDDFSIRGSDNKIYLLRVSGITENYTLHYIYMNEEYYEEIFGKELTNNIILANMDNDNLNEISTNLLKSDQILNVNYTKNNRDFFNTLLINLNKIIYLIIIAASLLAFTVLYNLTSININERIREIATLKVLGFKDKEVSNYVYREIIILTILGILLGLIFGRFLDYYVINTAETHNVIFSKNIKISSYLLSIILTMTFSLIVRFFTHFKLKKINMIESLKSVE